MCIFMHSWGKEWRWKGRGDYEGLPYVIICAQGIRRAIRTCQHQLCREATWYFDLRL